MIDRLGTWGESQSSGCGETLQCSSSVNKQQEALLEAAKGDAVVAVAALSPRRRPEPQINRALPHDQAVSFGTVTLHKAPQKWGVHWGPPPLPQEFPNNLCDCNTRTTAPPTYKPPSLKLQGKALPMLILVQLLETYCLLFVLSKWIIHILLRLCFLSSTLNNNNTMHSQMTNTIRAMWCNILMVEVAQNNTECWNIL